MNLYASCEFEYGWYNDTQKDKKYLKEKYEAKGYKDVSVKRVKTDTHGLKMYEITFFVLR